jgi:hypothetical protein
MEGGWLPHPLGGMVETRGKAVPGCAAGQPFRAGKRAEVSEIEPGMRVIHPERPEWGIGQVQSVVGDRVTVNFEHAGKLLLNLARVRLELVHG